MPIGSEQYRSALRLFPAGVTIVTIKAPGYATPHGLTVSAFASISTSPPLIMVSIDHRGTAREMLDVDGAVFAVNVLGQNQMELSNRFAWVKDEDRFLEGDWATAVTGAPVLNTALTWLDCTIQTRYPTGNHTIYIGEVQASATPHPDDAPLLYWNRGYRQLKLL